MDIDVTVKPIYGHQQGAQVGYNPHKAERPSHCYHSYFNSNTRLCLGLEVLGGRSAQPGMPCQAYGNCSMDCHARIGRRFCVATAATEMRCF
jgi:hypothetical protein